MVTKQSHRALQVIQDFIKTHGWSPTLEEIGEAMGLRSKGVVHRYVKTLADAGLVELLPNQKRNIRLTQAMDGIPLVGSIAAGLPIEAVVEAESISVGDLFLGEGRYALRVKGDSMVDEGILDGDIVVCQRSQLARNGDIVVALIDHEVATLKRVQFSEDATIMLLPANAAYAPQVYPRERVLIQGLFIGLMRLPKPACR